MAHPQQKEVIGLYMFHMLLWITLVISPSLFGTFNRFYSWNQIEWAASWNLQIRVISITALFLLFLFIITLFSLWFSGSIKTERYNWLVAFSEPITEIFLLVKMISVAWRLSEQLLTHKIYNYRIAKMWKILTHIPKIAPILKNSIPGYVCMLVCFSFWSLSFL